VGSVHAGLARFAAFGRGDIDGLSLMTDDCLFETGPAHTAYS
jgi:hypothetical protein